MQINIDHVEVLISKKTNKEYKRIKAGELEATAWKVDVKGNATPGYNTLQEGNTVEVEVTKQEKDGKTYHTITSAVGIEVIEPKPTQEAGRDDYGDRRQDSIERQSCLKTSFEAYAQHASFDDCLDKADTMQKWIHRLYLPKVK